MKRRILIVVMSTIVFLIVFLGIAVPGAAYHSGPSLQPSEANSRIILSSDGPSRRIAFVSDRIEPRGNALPVWSLEGTASPSPRTAAGTPSST